jgi:hypothetical protein
MYEELSRKGHNLQLQSKDREGKHVHEEFYNLVVEAYYPDNVLVLKAAHHLIKTLIKTGKYRDAEYYVCISYKCLTRSIDTETENVADAAGSLALVITNLMLTTGEESSDLVEAKILARKSLFAQELVYAPNHFTTVNPQIIISHVLSVKRNRNNEVKRNFVRKLSGYQYQMIWC